MLITKSGLGGCVCACCVLVVTRVPGACAHDCPLFLFVLFRAGGKTPDPKMQVRSYVDVMLEQNLSKEEVTQTTSSSTM